MKISIHIFFICWMAFVGSEVKAQIKQVPSDRILSGAELYDYSTPELRLQVGSQNKKDLSALAEYFRNAFAERYFYDWHLLKRRLAIYDSLYSNQSDHLSKARDFMSKFPDSTQWVLPFNDLKGNPVNAYALRHLARSHKMVDVAFSYFYDKKNPKYIHYFTTQMRSLNAALVAGKYEKIEDGNGVYEVFRGGYRILNWLRVHNMFLGEPAYSDQGQLTTIATMLQHAQHLYERNEKFSPGNHQTRGMSALAMLSILFKDFNGADQWYRRAMQRLGEHLNSEINNDGFQFERSVHYHISDIANYFYVYQLAKINGVKINSIWEDRLKSMFTTLTRLAFPDKTAPVLQDDTDRPWAEKNEISEVMALGYLLFGNPEFGYFSSNQVDSDMYWFINNNQLSALKTVASQKPKYKSISFDDTGYYIMRRGWEDNDAMMIISAGISDKKPDHQHGDMLGIQAYANGHVLLPNYQVRYSLPDYEFFKNSMVKNVALVDDIMQGRQYKGNKGGSGFGKFGYLPNPKVIYWDATKNHEIFIGSHDGFSEAGVHYTRKVFFVDDKFWIVKDDFVSEGNHDYKQVWQGHYTLEGYPIQLRSSFEDGSGLDIIQLNGSDTITQGGTRGKEWSVFVKSNEASDSFITLLHPFSKYNQSKNYANKTTVEGWGFNSSSAKAIGNDNVSLSKDDEAYLFNIREVDFDNVNLRFNENVDVYTKSTGTRVTLRFFGANETKIEVKGTKTFIVNNERKMNSAIVQPGDTVEILINK